MSVEFKRVVLLSGFLGFLLVGWQFSLDFGVSWDEPIRWADGDRKWEYSKSLITNQPLDPPGGHYPGLYDQTLSAFRDLTGIGLFASARLWNGLFFLIALAATFLLGKEIGGNRTGLLSVFILLTTPRFFGHGLINPKDIPFAAMYALGLWGLLKISKTNGTCVGTYLLFGILSGLAAAVRIGGLLLWGYLLGVYLVLALREIFSRESIQITKRDWLRRILGGLATGLLGYTVLFVFWPSLHGSGLDAVGATTQRVGNFGWGGFLLYGGEIVPADAVPSYYLPQMLLMTTPTLWMLLSGGFLVGYLWNLRTIFRCGQERFGELLAGGILWIACLFPMVYILGSGAQVYDGIRHVLFVLPPAVVMVAHGLVRVTQLLSRGWRRIAGVVVLGYGLSVGIMMFRLHPYQYTYFAEWTGGLKEMGKRYDSEYWATSYREAVLELRSLLDPVTAPPGGWRIATIPEREALLNRFEQAVLPPPALAILFFSEDMVWCYPEEAPDFTVSTSRLGYSAMVQGLELFRVEREGIEFARVSIHSQRGLDVLLAADRNALTEVRAGAPSE